MELENGVTEIIRSFSGIKSALPHGVLQSMDAEAILNFVTRKGKLRKIWGGDLYAELANDPGNRISWLDHFDYRWFAQQGGNIQVENSEGSATFTNLGGILRGSESRIRSTKWRNRLYMTNGCENKFFEKGLGGISSQKYLDLGLFPPGLGAKYVQTQPDLTLTKVAAVGSSLADATYGYVVTWWDANRRVESLSNGAQVGPDGLWQAFAQSFADSSRLTFSSMANNAVRVDISALKAFGYDASRVTHFIVYRQTQADPSVLKRVADPDSSVDEAALRISNDFYDDSTVEANLGLLLDESISPPPSGLYYEGYGNKALDNGAYGPKFMEFFLDRLWSFGPNYPGTENGTRLNEDNVSATQINYDPANGIAYASDAENFDYWKFNFNVGRELNQKDTGMAKHRNTLMFFKEKSAFYLDGTTIENAVIRELDVSRGITVPGSLAKTTVGVIGIGMEGFTLFDSVSGGQIISEELKEVAQINMDYADKIYATFDHAEEKYECHVPLDATAYNTRVFIYDCKLKCWEITDRAGGAAAYGISTGKRQVSMLGDPRNGRLYDTSDYSKVTLNGKTMHGSWKSKAFDFSRPDELKSVQMVEITASMVLDCRLTVGLITDFGQGDATIIEDCEPDVRGDRWAEDSNDEGMNWDAGQWSKGVEKKKFTILIQGTGTNFNLLIKNSDRDANRASFEIEEVIVYANRLSGSDTR